MQKCRLLTILIILLLVLLNITSLAQKRVDYRVKIGTSDWQPYKLAIGDFKTDTNSVAGDTLTSMIQKVITDDLDFHIFFDTVQTDQFYINTWEVKEMSPIIWFRMGANYLLDGRIKVEDDEVSVEYWIRELSSMGFNDLKHGKLKTKQQNYRKLAHMIADEVVVRIAAETPFFTTKLAFISNVDGNKELYLCDYDGANIVRLTNDKSTTLSPCWDRNGDKLLYTTYKRRKQQIWELDLNSAKSVLICNYPNSNNAASISPDNKDICVSLSKDGNAELYVTNRKGKAKRRLTKIPSIEVGASWSPSGNSIVFQSDRSGVPQIYIMDSEGLNVQRLTFEGRYNDSPDYSPRGDVIAFVSRGSSGRFQVCTIDVNGMNFTRLDQSGSNENPHFSPDGWHLVYCKRVGSRKDLYIMDRFQKRIKQITFSGKATNPAWQPAMK